FIHIVRHTERAFSCRTKGRISETRIKVEEYQVQSALTFVRLGLPEWFLTPFVYKNLLFQNNTALFTFVIVFICAEDYLTITLWAGNINANCSPFFKACVQVCYVFSPYGIEKSYYNRTKHKCSSYYTCCLRTRF